MGPTEPWDEPTDVRLRGFGDPPKWRRKPCAALAETFAESMIQGKVLVAGEIQLVPRPKASRTKSSTRARLSTSCCAMATRSSCSVDVTRQHLASDCKKAQVVIVATKNKSACTPACEPSRSTKAPQSSEDNAKARELRARYDAYKAEKYIRAIELCRAATEADRPEPVVVLSNLAPGGAPKSSANMPRRAKGRRARFRDLRRRLARGCVARSRARACDASPTTSARAAATRNCAASTRRRRAGRAALDQHGEAKLRKSLKRRLREC